jgi:hypothetical protein
VTWRLVTLCLLALGAAPSAIADGNLVSLTQIDTGSGGSIYINQSGLRNVIAGPSHPRLGTVFFSDEENGLHSYAPIAGSGDLFSLTNQTAAQIGSDGFLIVEQTGNDNLLAITGASNGQETTVLMRGQGNAVDIRPSSTVPATGFSYQLTFAAEGDHNLARLRPQPDSTISLEIAGNRNEFILNQENGSVRSHLALDIVGDDHAARVIQHEPDSTLDLTFLGTGVGPIEIRQYGGAMTMTFDTTVGTGDPSFTSGAPFTWTLPEN